MSNNHKQTNIPKYEEFKKFGINQLKILSEKIRNEILDLSRKKSIHLSSNLGVVELTISLLFSFDSPKDKIVFDTGHQCYIHKILTDRFDKLNTIKDFLGLSGFQENKESKHDFVSLGHSGNSISICQGASENDDNYYIPVIGDASITTGISMEALNNIAFRKNKMIIVLNDNNMSISKNVGYFHEFLNKKFKFTNKKNDNNLMKSLLNLHRYKDVKKLFKLLGFNYIGPVDGHNIEILLKSLEKAKKISVQKPTIVHVKTIKGYGYKAAEIDSDGIYHSINLSNKINDNSSYSCVAAKKLFNLIEEKKNIHIYNAAMTLSSCFSEIQKNFPKNYEDVGIAEEHMVSKAAGSCMIARNKIFIGIYSTFMQRSYDNIIHDVARNNLPIVFIVDRCGISYNDGNTHHGIYDVAFIKSTMNYIITSPSNDDELNQLIQLGYENNKNPFYIRISKDKCPIAKQKEKIKFGEWKKIVDVNSNECIISYGHDVWELKKLIDNNNIKFDLINAIFITSYDKKQIIQILKNYKKIYVIEKVIDLGCLANDLILLSFENQIKTKIVKFNIKTSDVGFGDKKQVDEKNNINLDKIYNGIVKKLY